MIWGFGQFSIVSWGLEIHGIHGREPLDIYFAAAAIAKGDVPLPCLIPRG